MSQTNLHSCLGRTRRRLVLIGAAVGLLWAGAAWIGVVAVSVWLDLVWDLPPSWRIGAVAAAGLAALLVLGALVVRTLGRATYACVARRLDQTAGSGGLILSGWELASVGPNSFSARPELVQGLSEIAVRHAADVSTRVPPSAAVSTRPLRRASLVLSALAVVVGLIAGFFPTLAYTEWRRFTQPFGDQPPFSLVSFDVEPGDTTVVYGEGLEVRVAVSGPVGDEVELVFHPQGEREEAVPMFPEGDGRWRATLARVVHRSSYIVRADRARSRRFHVDVITVPQIQSVRWRITPPRYTNQAAYEGPLPKEGIAGLEGTVVEVWAKSNRPLASGVLELSAGGQTSIELRTDSRGDDLVAGEFVLTAEGSFHLHLTDRDGQQSREPFSGSIKLLVDQRPFVRIIEPRATSLATPAANLPVVTAAEDDFGISRLQLYRSLNHSRPLPTDLPDPAPVVRGSPDPAPFPRTVQDHTYLPLAQYGLQPGDEIKLFARVEDNKPDEAQGAESSVVTVRIISQEDFERMVRARLGLQVLLSKYQQAQRRLEKLAQQIDELRKELAELPADSPAAEAIHERLRELAKQLEHESRAIEESARHLLPYDIDQNLTRELTDLAGKLADAAREVSEMESDPALTSGEANRQLAALAERLKANREQFDKNAMQPLEHLAAVQPLMECQARFVQLVLGQRDLAERLASLKGRDGQNDPGLKARMRELEGEQRMLREELTELLDDIENHAQRLPDDPLFDNLRRTALAFANDVRGSGAGEVMAGAEAALAEFSGTRGHELAATAAEILESFLGKCEAMGDSGGQCLAFHPSLNQYLGDTVQQLLAELGLSLGQGGFGLGQGGGYSARRNTMSNVGLYGGLPALGPSSSDGFGDAILGDGLSDALAGRDDARRPERYEAAAEAGSSGGSQAPVPLRYRKRVGEYLQRVAEETGT